MKNQLLTLLIFFSACSHAVATTDCPIIPLPSKVIKAEGQLPVRRITHVEVGDAALTGVARYFQQEVLRHTGQALSLLADNNQGVAVTLTLDANGKRGAEAYTLDIHPDRVHISAATPHGVFNGIASLLQLIRLATTDGQTATLDCWEIEDAPHLEWRGVMLDESRHFFGMETVKELLDWMAFYKLNRFHWHLTDAPGWRIEIRSFPKLTLVGGIGNHTNPLAPAAYYTQEEIKEIVRYAQERFIEVIPEIDMPGHAAAANRAYPAFSGGGSAKYPEFTFNPGKDSTYAYLTAILKEVDVLFPSKMIHLGGDEVHFGNAQWNTDKAVQRLMKENNLQNLKAVEQYFVKRMADSIMQFNAKVLGWDEMASTDIAPGKTIIFWWRHDKPETLQESLARGYRVVLCPRIPLYFDFVQDSTHIVGRKWAGTFSDLETVYEYSPAQYPGIINQKNRGQIAGIQANLWTERISSRARLQFMLFPRIAALAEAAWTDVKTREYSVFVETRLPVHETLYAAEGLRFYNAEQPALTPEVTQ